MGKTVFNAGQKLKPEKKAKTVNGRQNQRIAKLEKMLYPSVERKSRDVLAINAGVSTSGYSNQPMMQLEKGDSNNQRIGQKVTLLRHDVCMTLNRHDSTNSMRVIWFYTPSTTALDIADILEYGNYTAHNNLVFSSPYKRKAATAENTYRVLFDKVYHFKSTEQLITDKYSLIPNKNGRQVQFNSDGSVMPENYQLQIVAISDSAAAPNPSISYVCRTKYIDL